MSCSANSRSANSRSANSRSADSRSADSGRTNESHTAVPAAASEDQFRQLFEQASDGIFIADLNGRYTDVNSAGCHMLGYKREELVGKSITDLIPPGEEQRLWRSKEIMEHGGRHIAEWTLQRRDGSYLPVEISARILQDGRWQGVVRDISQRKQVESQLRQASVVFEHTREAIMIMDARFHITDVNPAFTDITGYPREDVLGQPPQRFQTSLREQEFSHIVSQALSLDGQWQGEINCRRREGELFPAWQSVSAVRNDQGQVSSYIAVFADISSLKEAEAQLVHQAHHDALTGLSNRLVFTSNLELALERASRHGYKVALLFLDLDRFKLINDTLGHEAGDELLRIIAGRLKRTVRAEDLISRLGGDEFTIILEEIAQGADAAALADKLINTIAMPMSLDGQEVATTASVGISVYPDDADNGSDLARMADAAMYRAKNNGRNTFRFYTSQYTREAKECLSVEGGLRRALERDELRLFYQLQIDLRSGKLCGVEALLRWQHPQLGLLSPDRFIGIAEESGQINAIGEWVMAQACRQAALWRDSHCLPARIAINLSARQLMYNRPLESLERALRSSNLTSADVRFELEITEGVLQRGESVVRVLRELRAMGVGIAIDDFGTGYSSLGHLKSLPVDALKIDRSFLKDVPNDADNQAITIAVIELGHNLGLKVTAEGVETREQLSFLQAHGCDEVQGFLYAAPMDATSVARYFYRRLS